MTRKHFLSLAGALLATPFGARALAREQRVIKPTVGFLSVNTMPPGTRCGDWLVIDPATGKNVEYSVSPRHWATDDGKPVTMYSIMWADDRTGAFGGEEITYSYWRKGCGVGDMLYQRGFHRQMQIRIVYTGSDPRYAAFKDTTINPFTDKRHS